MSKPTKEELDAAKSYDTRRAAVAIKSLEKFIGQVSPLDELKAAVAALYILQNEVEQ